MKITGTTLLWVGITLLIILNASLLTFHSVPNTKKTSTTKHIQQAYDLWRLGEFTQARREMQAALTRESLAIQTTNSEKSSGVLGAANDQSDIPSGDVSRAKLETQRTYWQAIVTKHPEYRDGWIALATLSYKLDDIKAARTYLDHAKRIDANNTTVDSLEKFVTQNAK